MLLWDFLQTPHLTLLSVTVRLFPCSSLFFQTHTHRRPLCPSGGRCVTDSCFKSHWGVICDPDTAAWLCLPLLVTCSTVFSPTATSWVSLISPIILWCPQLFVDPATVLSWCPPVSVPTPQRPWGNHYLWGKPLGVNRLWKQPRWHANGRGEVAQTRGSFGLWEAVFSFLFFNYLISPSVLPINGRSQSYFRPVRGEQTGKWH